MTTKRPIVAVDANPAARSVVTGTERYALEVARRLPATAPELEFRFYASRPGHVPGLDLTVLPGCRLWSQVRLPAELWRQVPDLLFAPAHVVPFLAPGKALTVVHDLAFERFPRAYHTADRAYLRLTTRYAERRCPKLIAVSQSTAADLTELHGVDPARIQVAPLGGGEPVQALPRPQTRRRLAELGLDRPYVLHVGRVEARKNQATALEAVERLDGLLLVCAGPVADRDLAGRLAASARCRVLGRVDADALEALYAGARALAFPSLYEGFGLPVLEAMRRGVPVAAARTSSLPEVGGDAAVYVDDPRDAGALAAAIERAIAERPRRARLGRAQAARFTWERTSTLVGAVIRELVLGAR